MFLIKKGACEIAKDIALYMEWEIALEMSWHGGSAVEAFEMRLKHVNQLEVATVNG